MIAYRCCVDMFSVKTPITKTVWRVKVVSIAGKYITIDDYGSKIKVEKKDIFDTPEEAEVECEKRALVLASKLQEWIELRLTELKAVPTKSDRVPSLIPPEAFT